MSAATSAVRGTSAADTSETLSAADVFELSTDRYYVAAAESPHRGKNLDQPCHRARVPSEPGRRNHPSAERAPHRMARRGCAGEPTQGRRFVTRAQWRDIRLVHRQRGGGGLA